MTEIVELRDELERTRRQRDRALAELERLKAERNTWPEYQPSRRNPWLIDGRGDQ